MRVAVVTTSYPKDPDDAAGHFVRTECRALAAQGHQVTVLAPGADLEPPADPAEPRVIRIEAGDAFGFPGVLPRLIESPARIRHVARFALGCRRELSRAGPWDRVIAHWVIPAAWPIAARGSWPLEVVAHGSDVRLLVRAPRVARWVLASLAARDATFRCVSQNLADSLTSLGPGLKLRIRVEPCALDVIGVPSRARARLQLGIAEDARLTAIVGRLIPSKRVHVALGAATLVPDLTVVVVGDGPSREPLQRAFPDARFTGALSRSEALQWIAAADLVLSASLDEGAPSVIREARALGVPVVCRPSGDVATWAEGDPELFVTGAPSMRRPSSAGEERGPTQERNRGRS